MALTIRAATPADAAAILRVYMESAMHHRELAPDRYLIPAEPEILERYGEPPTAHSTTLVAIDNGEIVGFVEARLQPPVDPMHRPTLFCHILEIAVSADRRSEGIGRALMSAITDWARAAGAEFLSLEYLASNVRAAAFYERLGFRAASVVAIKPIQRL